MTDRPTPVLFLFFYAFVVVSGGLTSKRYFYLGFIRHKVGPLGIVFVTDGCVYVGYSGDVSFSIHLLTCISSSIE